MDYKVIITGCILLVIGVVFASSVIDTTNTVYVAHRNDSATINQFGNTSGYDNTITNLASVNTMEDLNAILSCNIASGSGNGNVTVAFNGDTVYNRLFNLEKFTHYDMLSDNDRSDGSAENNITFIGYNESTSILYRTEFLLKDVSIGYITDINVTLTPDTLTPEDNNFTYRILFCPTSVSNLTDNATYGADCSSAPVSAETDVDLSVAFGAISTNVTKQISLTTPYGVTSAGNYILIFNYTSGGNLTGEGYMIQSDSDQTDLNYNYRTVNNNSVVTLTNDIANIELRSNRNLTYVPVYFNSNNITDNSNQILTFGSDAIDNYYSSCVLTYPISLAPEGSNRSIMSIIPILFILLVVIIGYKYVKK